MFYYFGIGINIFLLLILVAKRGKTLADNILVAWLFVIALHTISFVLTLQPVNASNIHLTMGVSAPFPLIHGPFLYLYTAASTNMFPLKKRGWLLHFIPFLLTIAFLTPLYLKSGHEKVDIYMHGGAEYRFINFILGIIIQFSGLIYVAWSFVLLNKHKKNIGEQFSYEEKINLNWLRYLIYGLLAVWIVIIVLKKDSLIFGAGVVFITLLGFLGVQQVGIFGKNQGSVPNDFKTDLEPATVKEKIAAAEIENDILKEVKVAGGPAPTKDEETIIAKKKYAKSGLTADVAAEIHKKLKQGMESQKLYTEPELSLSMLAGKINVHPNYLSQVINEKEGKSFFDYINNLRVEEFKRLMALPNSSQFTMLSLAYDCGFNSKSSFNKNFKKATGHSPSEYFAGLTGNY
jgi:AraC-like DNA-binding protein